MILEQAIRLVSRAPENLAYHFITLLALQAAVGVAGWQWRRAENDPFAGRLLAAAGGLFLLRLILVGVLMTTPADDVLRLLPPLERAIDTAGIVLLTWALVPPPQAAPRVASGLLLLGLFLTGTAAIFAVQDWAIKVDLLTYGATNQAAAWAAGQLIVTGLGVVILLISRPADWVARGLVLLPLLTAAGLHAVFFLPPESGESLAPAVSSGAVPVWMRLAYLVSWPVLAAVAYRHTLTALLQARTVAGSLREVVGETLTLAGEAVAATAERGEADLAAAQVAAQVLDVPFAAVATFWGREGAYVQAAVVRDGRPGTEPWLLKLEDWPAMSMAVRQKKTVALVPDGLGARQLYELHQELNLQAAGPLLIVPLQAAERLWGVLLVGQPQSVGAWPDADRPLVQQVADFTARLLMHGRGGEPAESAERQSLQRPERENETMPVVAADGDEAESWLGWATQAMTNYSGELDEARRRMDLMRREPDHSTSVSDPATAVEKVTGDRSDQVEQKRLRVDLHLPSDLPAVAVPVEALQEGLQLVWRFVLRCAPPNTTVRVSAGVAVLSLRPDDGEIAVPTVRVEIVAGRPLQAVTPAAEAALLQAVHQRLAVYNARLWWRDERGFVLLLPMVADDDA